MTTNTLRRRSPNPWPISRRYKDRKDIRPPLPSVCTGRAAGSAPGAVLQLLFGVFLVLSPLLLAPADAAQTWDGPIRAAIQNGGYAVRTASGKPAGFNVDTPFIPASTVKLITCLAALASLGPDYRFETLFYLDAEGKVIIKGEGDPVLTSEEAAAIARDLAVRGLRRVRALILDVSAFALKSGVDGSEHSDRPYDVDVGPLDVNFNALPLQVHGDGRIDSGEDQTPVLPMMQAIGRTMHPGLYRINIGAFATRGDLTNEQRYTGELFRNQLERQGIEVGGPTTLGTVPDKAALLLVHRSEPLRDIIRECLEFSNNFIANELFLACGRKRFGFPATWTKARRALKIFIDTAFHPQPGTITMVEGSGLSRKNRVTPNMMLEVLERFTPFADLLPIKHDLLMKSGTLKGVYCYAGYLEEQGKAVPFAIMLNQPTNSRDGILRILKMHLR